MINTSTAPSVRAADAFSLNSLLLLDANDVLSLLDRQHAILIVTEALTHHSAGTGRVYPMIREPIAENAVFGIKAGDIACKAVLGFKAAGFWPSNEKLGKDKHQATILLIDPATGRPVCLLDGNHVTTLRTGAAGAIGLQMLARPDSKHICVFGTGVQAKIHLDYALQVLPALQIISYVTYSGQPDPSFEALHETHRRVIHHVDSNLAVASADVVITATPSRTALFSDGAIRPGTHINAVGADTVGKRELPEGLLARSEVFVDDAKQSRGVGEAQWSLQTPLTEIGSVLLSQAPYERAATAITVFDMTGLALQDLAVAQWIFDAARGAGRGQKIAWPW